MIYMCFPAGRRKALTLSYDDGVEQDMELVSVLDKHGLKGTFNLNSGAYSPEGTVHPAGRVHRRMTEKQIDELFAHSSHEVALHALTHPFLEQLPQGMLAREIMQDRENLEAQFGRIVRGMAYPYGTYSDEVVAALRACGIAYARTVKSTFRFDVPTDWLRMPATCHHTEEALPSLTKRFVEEAPVYGSWLFYLWGHSYEFEQFNNWKIIYDFAAATGERADIWYATNIEIYDYVTAYRMMQASADGHILHNPTATELWFDAGKGAQMIAPGETLKL